MVEMKKKWKGVFSYRCELERLYAHAYSKEQARVVMCRRLAKKHDVHPATVLAIFDGSKDNFSITEEVKEIEDDVA
jgi:hypothetical protein